MTEHSDYAEVLKIPPKAMAIILDVMRDMPLLIRCGDGYDQMLRDRDSDERDAGFFDPLLTDLSSRTVRPLPPPAQTQQQTTGGSTNTKDIRTC